MPENRTFLAHIATARPRVLGVLARYFRDLDLAEDAVQEASERALTSWPASGLPRDPAAWLIRAGRNAGIDQIRKSKRHDSYAKDLYDQPVSEHPESALIEIMDQGEMRDDVLRLMFMCCHSDLSQQDQLALALKVIGGFTVDQIAGAFLVKPKAMEQRITRAKKKAAALGQHLQTPNAMDRRQRLDAVCVMVYLLFNEGYSAAGGGTHIKSALCAEAIRLARLLVQLFPSQPEVTGLLALFLLQNSRRLARLDDNGELVGLENQDRSLWNRDDIAEGRVLLEKALRTGRPGAYQIQAAIAAVHCNAADAETTDWSEIELLYGALENAAPSPVVSLNRAVAISKTQGPEAALEALSGLDEALSSYLHFHATRAGLLADLGRDQEALIAYQRSLELQPSKAEADHIAKKISELRVH